MDYYSENGIFEPLTAGGEVFSTQAARALSGGDQHNFVLTPTELENGTVFLATNTDRDITGIVPPPSPLGYSLVIFCLGPGRLSLRAQNTGSIAINRFGSDQNIRIRQGQFMRCIYINGSWYVEGRG